MTASTQIITAKDTAQMAVTALLHGQRALAGDLVSEYTEDNDPMALALVAVDLVAHIHTRWADALGCDRGEAWSHLMADVEEWRTAGPNR
jgi:hypothetical protein